MDTADLIQAQDEQRTARSFIAFLSTALGVEQSMAGADGYAYNAPRQYQSIGPGGLVGVEGIASSNGQSLTLTTSPIVLIALAVGVYLLMKN